jgi:excisionase family DNA binding protein
MSDTPSVEPIFVSVKDAARILSVSPFTVYQLLDDRKVVSQYEGRRRLVRLASLREYADNLPTEAPVEDATA